MKVEKFVERCFCKKNLQACAHARTQNVVNELERRAQKEFVKVVGVRT